MKLLLCVDFSGPGYNTGLCILTPAWHWVLASKSSVGTGVAFQSKQNNNLRQRGVAEKNPTIKPDEIEVKVSAVLKVA